MRFRCALPLCCLLAITTTTRADEAPPLALTKVPGDAGVFLHVNVAKAWDHPLMVAARTLGAREVYRLSDDFKKSTGVHLGEMESITLYVPQFTQPDDMREVAFVFTTRRPYNREAVLKAAEPSGATIVGAKKEVNETDADGFYKYAYLGGLSASGFRLHFTTPTTFAILAKGLGKAYLDANPTLKDGILGDALKRAASGKHTAVGALNLANTPRDFVLQEPPPEVRPYLALFKARTVTAWADAGKTIDLTVRFGADGETNARDCEDAARTALRLFEQLLEDGKASIDRNVPTKEQGALAHTVVDTILTTLKTAKVTRDGLDVTATATAKLEKSFVPDALKLILMGNAGPSTARNVNNLKQIGLALHNYAAVHGGLPPATILGKGGKPLLSWRVAILPYLEQKALYDQFKLDEPWDSEHNKALLKTMPRTYLMSGESPVDGKSRYRVLVGGGALFENLLPITFPAVRDGTSATIMVVEAEEAVPWTKPEPLIYDPKKPLPKLHFDAAGRANLLFVDGSVHGIKKGIAEKTLRALITRAGGEVVDDF